MIRYLYLLTFTKICCTFIPSKDVPGHRVNNPQTPVTVDLRRLDASVMTSLDGIQF